jgi:hypothetical protein
MSSLDNAAYCRKGFDDAACSIRKAVGLFRWHYKVMATGCDGNRLKHDKPQIEATG